MPSLRTIFLLATAAFASFTYAAPMSETSSGVTTPFTGTTPNNLALLPLPNTGNSNGNSQGVQAANPAAKRGSAPDSLPVILKALEAKLQGILGELHRVVGAEAVVDPVLCLPILREVRQVLAAVLKSVQALVGLPLAVVCALAGKVLSALDIARLLAAVLMLLCQILLLVSQVVGAVGLKVVQPLIAEIGSILCQILTCVFKLVEGLLAALVPLLSEVIKDLVTLKLEAVLQVLKVSHP